MPHYAIDRFEDNGWAVLERSDGETFNVLREWILEEAQEGDVLNVDVASKGVVSRISLAVTVDARETDKRREDASYPFRLNTK